MKLWLLDFQCFHIILRDIHSKIKTTQKAIKTIIGAGTFPLTSVLWAEILTAHSSLMYSFLV